MTKPKPNPKAAHQQKRPTQASSERRRFFVRVEMEQLDLDEKLQTVVAVEHLQTGLDRQSAVVADYLMELPRRLAPAIVRCATPALVHNCLTEDIYKALMNLSDGATDKEHLNEKQN